MMIESSKFTNINHSLRLFYLNISFHLLPDQTNLRNGTNASTSNTTTTIINTNGTISGTNTAANNISSGSGGVVLGQIGESILYYDSQNQSFQL